MGTFGIGKPVRRKEDNRFVLGNGIYQDDVELGNVTYAAFVRSPYAYADIISVDKSAALNIPGVLAVLTSVDLPNHLYNGFPCLADIWIDLECGAGQPAKYPHNPLLATKRVRHVGETVAMVISRTLSSAKLAVEAVNVIYNELAPIVDTASATLETSPQIHSEVPHNISFVWEHGDDSRTKAVFESAAHVTSIELINNRVAVMPIEPRGATGSFDTESKTFTLVTNAQHIYDTQLVMSKILGVERDKIRVIANDLGGGFGMKYVSYPEQALVLIAGYLTGTRVKWMSDRSEAFLSDTQARDHVSSAKLALDRSGHFLGLAVVTYANLGAYASNLGPVCPSILYTRMLSCAYQIPAIHAKVTGVYTNTIFTDAYRGAGQPEAIYLVERIIDKAAREMSITPDKLRRLNFIRPDQMPYTTAVDMVYDSGDYKSVLDRCLELSDWTTIESRRLESQQKNKCRGIGLSMYVEATTGDPHEEAKIEFIEDDKVKVWLGTKSSGQGHETTYSQLLSDMLGIDFDSIAIFEGDTQEITTGGGSGGSRSIYMAGMALRNGADKVIEKGVDIAADMLEVGSGDIRFKDGNFTIVGTDRNIDLMSVARYARNAALDPLAFESGLNSLGTYEFSGSTVPNGCHIAEVEIDLETGKVEVISYNSVSDFGRVINPLLLEAQVHGGVAQGLGQAMMEEVRYDKRSGQLLTGSFMDYCMPRADDLPFFISEATNIPCPTNLLGVKGCGEAGTIAACATLVNAIIDALSKFNIEHIDMPVSPEKIWRLIYDT